MESVRFLVAFAIADLRKVATVITEHESRLHSTGAAEAEIRAVRAMGDLLSERYVSYSRAASEAVG